MVQSCTQSCGLQGVWTKWQNIISRDISWKFVFSKSFYLERFCISATFNTLGTPDNLFRMGKSVASKCHLCNGTGCGILHILSACNQALALGRYKYRHDNILSVIVSAISNFLISPRPISSGIKEIHFIRETGNPINKKRKKPYFGLLHHASDWCLLSDIGSQLKFPSHIAENISNRPDIVIFSDIGKILIFIELTSPCEENFEERHKQKFNRYGPNSDIFRACQKNGWEVYVFPVEVGARGYAATSLQFCLSRLGMPWKTVTTTVKLCSDAALRSSFWIWTSFLESSPDNQ